MSKRKSIGQESLFLNLTRWAGTFAVVLLLLFRPDVALGDFWNDCVCPATGQDEIVSYDCGDVTYEGCCQGDFVTWCEGGKLHCRNCVAAGEVCSWDMIWQFYGCDDTSNPMEDPSGYNPIDCDFAHCDADTDTDTDTDGDADTDTDTNPVCPGTGGVYLETTPGVCWYAGSKDGTCAAKCSAVGSVYSNVTATYAGDSGSGGTKAHCWEVLDALGVGCDPTVSDLSCNNGIGCHYDSATAWYRCYSPTTTSTAHYSTSYRACACEIPSGDADSDTDTDTDTDTEVDCDSGGALVGGSCWYLAESNESCAETCSTHGGYDEATKTYAGSAGTVANCKAVLNALGGYNYWRGDVCGLGGIGCHKYTGNGWRDLAPTTADATPNDGSKRACACVGNGVVMPEPIHALFVSNRYSYEEYQIEDHLNEIGAYNVTVKGDWQITGYTDLSGYDLIVITGFAPYISTNGLYNISNSGIPVLIVEYWGFEYSYRLGLVYDSPSWSWNDTIKLPNAVNEYTRFLGTSVEVYQSPSYVESISGWALKDEVTPIAAVCDDVHGSGCQDYDSDCWYEDCQDGEYSDMDFAAISDSDRNIIATGLSDVSHYTESSWRMFDLMLNKLRPAVPEWESEERLLEGYIDSGLAGYIESLQGDEPAGEVKAVVWGLMLRWNLFDLYEYIQERLRQVSPDFVYIIPPIAVAKIHPQYTLPPYDQDWPDDQIPRWFLGQYKEHAEDIVATVPDHGDYIEGSDLGISTSIGGKTYFFMGDTAAKYSPRSDEQENEYLRNIYPPLDLYPHPTPMVPPGSHNGFSGKCGGSGDIRAECDDAVVVMDNSAEINPGNGVDIEPFVNSEFIGVQFFDLPRSLSVDGVHVNYGLEFLWDRSKYNYWGYNVVTGALSMFKPVYVSQGDPPVVVTLQAPYFQLWYTTHCRAEGTAEKPGTARSWVGCSMFNTIEFGNCYEPNSPADKYFSASRFINVAPIRIGSEELAAMGANAPPSPSGSGYLLYGSSSPYRCAPVYLAYVDSADFGVWDEDSNLPKGIKFFKKDGSTISWENAETQATPITGDVGDVICYHDKETFINHLSETECFKSAVSLKYGRAFVRTAVRIAVRIAIEITVRVAIRVATAIVVIIIVVVVVIIIIEELPGK
jgi:hypothetical protein